MAEAAMSTVMMMLMHIRISKLFHDSLRYILKTAIVKIYDISLFEFRYWVSGGLIRPWQVPARLGIGIVADIRPRKNPPNADPAGT